MASTVSGLRGGGATGASITVENAREIQQFFDRLRKNVPLALAKQIRKEGDKILDISRPAVPIDTYILRESGRVQGPEQESAHRWMTMVGYGGEKVRANGNGFDYSIIQHENFAYAHRNGGRAKYLEQPALAHAYGPMKGSLDDAVVSSIRAAI